MKENKKASGIKAMALGGLALFLFIGAFVFIIRKAHVPAPVFETCVPTMGDIETSTVASGRIVPRKESQIRSQATGMIVSRFVQPGDNVRKGTVLARIALTPNLQSLNDARSILEKAQLACNEANRILEQQETLLTQGVVSESTTADTRARAKNAAIDLDSARTNYRLLKAGSATLNSGSDSSIVKSPVDGTVLEVNVEEGDTVIETTPTCVGTTVATIADMDSLIFEGTIDESEVGKLYEGQELELVIGAIENATFKARLETIAPKGTQEREGSIQFSFRAGVERQQKYFLRSGYSANAKIILKKKAGVLLLCEGAVQFDKDQRAFVEVRKGAQGFERRDVELGISDGLNIEIVSGLTTDDTVKIPNGSGI